MLGHQNPFVWAGECWSGGASPHLGCWDWGHPLGGLPYSVPVAAEAEGGGMPHGSGLTPLPAPASVTAVKLPDGVTFIVYEFWETEEDWKR